MKAKDLIMLNVDVSGMEPLEEAIRKIGPLKKYGMDEVIHSDILEKALYKVAGMANIKPSYIFSSYHKKDDGKIERTKSFPLMNDKHENITTIYGKTFYECMCKGLIFCYAKYMQEKRK